MPGIELFEESQSAELELHGKMRILRTGAELRAWSRGQRAAGGRVGLVPTMGALHAGHISLVEEARKRCSAVVLSIFVNPTQFGPNEDLARYPRTFYEDCEKAAAAGVDAIFAPDVPEMYPDGSCTFVTVELLSTKLDGASRPGHFRGVATVVSKLFLLAEPDFAFFGQKDAAQVAVLKRMVRDMGFALQVVVCPIVREPDGLALSSRNVYLDVEARQRALVLSRALTRVAELREQGVVLSASFRTAMASVLAEEPTVELDYVAIVNPETLEAVADVQDGALVALAAWVSGGGARTRLIDNLLLTPAER